jgi:2,4-dienoyl-CoA reductase-like NADH-dependent reductase (Old Yellow Enzyme family)
MNPAEINSNPSDPLLQPFTLKGLTLRNRIMSTSHASGHENDGMPKESYQRYHEEKAKGGLALTMFGGSSNVSPDSANVFRQLNVGRDDVVPYFRQFAARIHKHGAALMCQISHLGRRSEAGSDLWLPAVAPSRVRETAHRSIPKEMDDDDIRRIVKDYGQAARRCLEGDLDGLETMASGHLIGQFLSPATNRRRDDFGGTLENRVRFARMVHEEIRTQVGSDFIVGIRYVIFERKPGWLTLEDSLRAAQILEADGTIDFFNLNVGRIDTERALAEDNMPGMEQPPAAFLEEVAQFRSELKLPVFHAARIINIETARQAVRDGVVDMVGMTRAHIADPHLVRKIKRGAEARIRPCIGAMVCLHKRPSSCVHNPATSRELTLSHDISQAEKPGRKVVVVGGGPGGLEAARVSALRGHEVILFEATSELGGQIRWAARAGWRRELIKVVDWRKTELAHLDVEVQLNRFVTEADVLAEHPDVVIIATGGRPDLTGIVGSAQCLSVWDVLAPAQPNGPDLKKDVLIYDGTGLHPAPSCADYLAGLGHQITFVTLDDRIAYEMGTLERVVYRKHFHQHGIRIHTDLRLSVVDRRAGKMVATFVNELTDQVESLTADDIVIEQGTLPVDQLYQALRSRSWNDGVSDIERLIGDNSQLSQNDQKSGFELHRIGDAIASRTIHAAIYDALRLCAAL